MRKKGCTLIELLVTVAIIAIFAAMLLPVLSNAVENSEQAVCMSNLKQLGQAWRMYANDNNAYLPGWECQSGQSNYDGPNWFGEILQYVSKAPGDFNDTTYMPYLKSIEATGNSVFQCPSQNPHFIYTDYACNAGYVQFGASWAGADGVKLSSIPKPSLTFMISDRGADTDVFLISTSKVREQDPQTLKPRYPLPQKDTR